MGWANNVQGKLKFTVPADISDFTIVLDTDIPLTNIQFYTANVSPMTGNQFTLTNMDWFSGLQAGDTLELDYQMTFAGDVQPTLTGITLNGQDACSGSGPIVTTATTVSGNTGDTTTPAVQSTTTAGTGGTTTTGPGSTCSAERYDYGRVLVLS